MGEVDRIATEKAPKAIGPYCQATRAAGLLFCSGQIPLDPRTGKLIEGDIGAMTLRCLQSLEAICEQAGTSLRRALKLTVYVCDLRKFQQVNEAYADFFGSTAPARTTIEVSALPADAEVEIDAIVALDEA